MLRTLFLAANAAAVSGAGVRDGAGSNWTRIGPWNIFNGVDPTKSSSMGWFYILNPRPGMASRARLQPILVRVRSLSLNRIP